MEVERARRDAPESARHTYYYPTPREPRRGIKRSSERLRGHLETASCRVSRRLRRRSLRNSASHRRPRAAAPLSARRRRYLIKLPAPGSDPTLRSDAGPAAGSRYKRAKYGVDEEDADERTLGGASSKKPSSSSAAAALTGRSRADDPGDDDDAGVPPHFDLLVVFALGIVRAILRKAQGGEKERADGELDAGEEGGPSLSRPSVSVLEGLVPLAVRALASPHAAVPPLATRVLAQLSTMRLSSFDASTGALGRRIMALLKDTPASDVALTADCVKLLNNLLKRHAAFAPTDAQFRFICQRCFGDLEGDLNPMLRSGGADSSGGGDRVSAASTFALMRAVMARRPMIPEIYDVARNVAELVVRAPAAETRALCAKALVQFLLDYPLGERVMRGYLDRLAANLEYEHAAGRLSAARCVRDVVEKFPASAVEAHAMFFFVPLVARLGADEDAKCREAVGECLGALLRRVRDAGVARKLLTLLVAWLAPPERVFSGKNSGGGPKGPLGDPRLRRSALQTLGFAIRACPSEAKRALRASRCLVAAALRESDPRAGGDARDDDETVRGWRVAYFACRLAEAARVAGGGCAEALFGPPPRGDGGDDDAADEEDDDLMPDDEYARAAASAAAALGEEAAALDAPGAIWGLCEALLRHRHQWVQSVASRVVGHFLAVEGAALARRAVEEKGDPGAANANNASFDASPISLERVARHTLGILEQGAGAGAVDLDAGLAEQATKNLVFVSAALVRAEMMTTDDENAASARGGDEKSLDASDERGSRDSRPPLPWLFRRMGKVCAGATSAARSAALRWTAALAATLGPDAFASRANDSNHSKLRMRFELAAALMRPAVLCADANTGGVEEAHRARAEEALEVLRDAMPPEAFTRAYAAARESIDAARNERRRKKALERATDPERAARAKIVKAGKRKEARKRKVQAFRAGKGASESSKKRAKRA